MSTLLRRLIAAEIPIKIIYSRFTQSHEKSIEAVPWLAAGMQRFCCAPRMFYWN
jgi:hypothetical protein